MKTPRTDKYKFRIGDSDHFAIHEIYARQLETELESEREKAAKLRDALSNFTHGQIGDMVCICGNPDGDKCSATTAEKALEETK